MYVCVALSSAEDDSFKENVVAYVPSLLFGWINPDDESSALCKFRLCVCAHKRTGIELCLRPQVCKV